MISLSFFPPNVHVLCSKHVLTEDTVQREVVSGKLRSIRFLTKTGQGPRWADKFVPHSLVGIIEESIVDPKTQTLTTYTRNIGYSKIVVCSFCDDFIFWILTIYFFKNLTFSEHHWESRISPRSNKPPANYCGKKGLDWITVSYFNT